MSKETADERAGFENVLNEDIPGTRERKLTEKGREERIRRLNNGK